MKLTKDKLEYGLILVEKKPSRHTTKLHKIKVIKVYEGYNYANNRAYTYVTAQTLENSFYPAANSTENKPRYLDGVFGTYTLKKLKAEYEIVDNKVSNIPDPVAWQKEQRMERDIG